MYNKEYSVCPCCRNMIRRQEGRFGLGGGFGHGFRHGLEHGYNQYDREGRRDIMKYRCCPSNQDEREEREIARYYREIEAREEKEREEKERENYYFNSYYNSYYNRENYEEPKNEVSKKGVVVLYYWKSCGHCHVMTREGGSFGDIDKLHKEHPDLHFVKIETDELNNYSNPSIDPIILEEIKRIGSSINAFPVLKIFTKVGDKVVVHELKDRQNFAKEAREKLENGSHVKRENYQENKKDVVLLYADWCPHCKSLIQEGGKWFELNKLKQEYPKHNFHKFEQKDFDKAPDHIKKHTKSIQGFPTVLVIDKESGKAEEIDRNLKNLN